MTVKRFIEHCENHNKHKREFQELHDSLPPLEASRLRTIRSNIHIYNSGHIGRLFLEFMDNLPPPPTPDPEHMPWREPCKECGSTDQSWHLGRRSSIREGRLRTSDVRIFFYLGCNECSETLKIVRDDQFIDKFEEMEKKLYEKSNELPGNGAGSCHQEREGG